MELTFKIVVLRVGYSPDHISEIWLRKRRSILTLVLFVYFFILTSICDQLLDDAWILHRPLTIINQVLKGRVHASWLQLVWKKTHLYICWYFFHLIIALGKYSGMHKSIITFNYNECLIYNLLVNQCFIHVVI